MVVGGAGDDLLLFSRKNAPARRKPGSRVTKVQDAFFFLFAFIRGWDRPLAWQIDTYMLSWRTDGGGFGDIS